MKTLYDLLGVSPDADAEAIKKAFRQGVKAHHPDVHGGDPHATQRFQAIIAANAILRDAALRTIYDQELERRSGRRRAEWKRTLVACAIAAILGSGLAGGGALLMRVGTPAIFAGEDANGHTDAPALERESKQAASAPAATSAGDETKADPEPAHSAPAIADAEQAIRRDPDDAKGRDDPGDAGADAGTLERALADYDQTLATDPKNPAILHERGMLLARKGALDNALLDLDRAIRFSFSDAEMYRDRGLVWYEKGRYDRAIADFNQAIKLDPKFADAYFSRGVALHHKGDLSRAFADVDRAVRIDPNMLDVIRREPWTH
jgi:curved DNA-binding protein CbpA